MLLSLTIAINFLSLMIALWLGLYLITRGLSRPAAWLSALALWSMGGYFLNELLALNPPSAPLQDIKVWLVHLILFWPDTVFELGWIGWLQGWLASYSVIFGYHATLYFLPGRFNSRRLIGALAGYALTFAGIQVKFYFSPNWANLAGDPLYLLSYQGSHSELLWIGFIIFAGLIIYNLWRAARNATAAELRAQLRLLMAAVLLGAAAAVLSALSTLFNGLIPQALVAALLAVVLLAGGTGVARYHALLGHRPMKRDFLFHAAGACAVLLAFLFAAWVLAGFTALPANTFLLVGCLAILTHGIIDFARIKLGTSDIYNQNRLTRRRLRQLNNSFGKMEENRIFEMAMETLAGVIHISWAVLLRLTPKGVRLVTTWNWLGPPLKAAADQLESDDLNADTLSLVNHRFPPPLDQSTVLVPLHQQEQKGVLLVGPSRNPAGYSKADTELLQNVGDLIANLIHELPTSGESLADVKDGGLEGSNGTIPSGLVELGLRNLSNYTYLADLPLSRLSIVQECLDHLERGTNTHIDRGKAVSNMLAEAVFKLRPGQVEPDGPPPRSWHPFIILRDAYIDDRPNLEIMSRLYISESTFNRTRRSAIKSVARIMEEMEASLKDQP